MEYIICIIIMLVWAMVFYCWGYKNGAKDLNNEIERQLKRIRGERNDV